MAENDDNASQAVELNRVFTDVYAQLKELAKRRRAQAGSPRTLCTTELVHEAFLRVGGADFKIGETAQFFAYAARAMRHILVDAARRRGQIKRGSEHVHIPLDTPAGEAVLVDPELAMQLDHALTILEKEDPRAARVVELHYFGGLELQQVAEVLGVARRTIDRDWRYARAALAAHAEEH